MLTMMKTTGTASVGQSVEVWEGRKRERERERMEVRVAGEGVDTYAVYQAPRTRALREKIIWNFSSAYCKFRLL